MQFWNASFPISSSHYVLLCDYFRTQTVRFSAFMCFVCSQINLLWGISSFNVKANICHLCADDAQIHFSRTLRILPNEYNLRFTQYCRLVWWRQSATKWNYYHITRCAQSYLSTGEYWRWIHQCCLQSWFWAESQFECMSSH